MYSFLTFEQEQKLKGIVSTWFTAKNESAPNELFKAGFCYPDKPPTQWNTLPEEWSALMESKTIVGLADVELEKYLQSWLDLLGYAYWVQSIWQDRLNTITKCAEFIKDYVFTHAPGGREQKGAVAGSHPSYKEAMDEAVEAERKLTMLNGLIRRWEKIEFTISRTITNRQNRPTR